MADADRPAWSRPDRELLAVVRAYRADIAYALRNGERGPADHERPPWSHPHPPLLKIVRVYRADLQAALRNRSPRS